MEQDNVMGDQRAKIIFVDDDPLLIHGLECSLRDMNKEWDMSFAGSGKEALQIMEAKNFDVVVTDMRMPDMTGAQLLNEVKKLYPNTIRFILSGYSDEKMVLETIHATDQFLNKPCKEEELKTAIKESLEARRILHNSKIAEVVSKMEHLPAMPALYIKLKRLLADKNSSLKEISDLISMDVSITAKILQLVNSAFFGLRHRIVDIHQATVYLGIKTIKAVIIMADLFTKFSDEEMKIFNIEELYQHSVLVGNISRAIAAEVSNKMVDSASMAGLLHDVGKIIFIRNYFDEYKKCYNESEVSRRPIWEIEKSLIGLTHADAGGYLMSIWGIPAEIVQAIVFHHQSPEATNEITLCTIVQTSNVLYHKILAEKAEDQEKIDYYTECLANLNLSPEHLQQWSETAQSIITYTEDSFDCFK